MSVMLDLENLQKRHPIQRGEPAWDIAWLYPVQGEWTEDAYLALNTNRMIELSEGCLEVLPMPTPYHQRIVQMLFKLLEAWVLAHKLGEVFVAPLPVRLWAGKLREPDIIFVRPERIYNPKRPPAGADLAMEVVSPGQENRERDLETKRQEYAQARIPEYWIIDPELQHITVLALVDTTYRIHGEFGPGSTATSVLLNGFSVQVDAVFGAGLGQTSNGQP